MHPEDEGPPEDAGGSDEGPDAVRRATDVCLKLLSMRARSRHELDAALTRKGFTAKVRDEALSRVQGWGYLDDARFAQERAASLLRKGRLGPQAVLQRLEAHGLGEAAAREALARATHVEAFDALAAARAVLEGKGLLGRPLSAKERARAGRLLDSRGFSEDVVHRLLGEPSLDPSGPDE
ncbi:regulatory protein RecX [Pyxidicoccus xibeiensis]|uniref:regulatory protein RecX n=1 Tax=Pyxidicoccus xibeiensis TaxID=2906759 RepID=UPI0020A7C768|nr:regulatory protein RecX [Pyxidicoccus xibeiensis]MCP3138460.1 recombination regulator RecX [Pyxidicoccus xibeiensis]